MRIMISQKEQAHFRRIWMKLYHAHGAENNYRSETLTHRGRYKHREALDTECAKNAMKRNGKQNGKRWKGERRDDESN